TVEDHPMDRCRDCNATMDYDERICPRCGQPAPGPEAYAPDVSFPALQLYDLSRDAILFPALMEGDAVRCVITRAALCRLGVASHFAGDPETVFATNRRELEAIAKRLIRLGRVGPGHELLIGVRDVP